MEILASCKMLDSGEVKINGKCLFSNSAEFRKDISYLPEIDTLHPELTVLEMLSYIADVKGLNKTLKRQSIQEILNIFNLYSLKKKIIANLSKGQRRRVSLACTFISKPRYVVLDEPTDGLDPAQIMQFREYLLGIKKHSSVFISSYSV